MFSAFANGLRNEQNEIASSAVDALVDSVLVALDEAVKRPTSVDMHVKLAQTVNSAAPQLVRFCSEFFFFSDFQKSFAKATAMRSGSSEAVRACASYCRDALSDLLAVNNRLLSAAADGQSDSVLKVFDCCVIFSSHIALFLLLFISYCISQCFSVVIFSSHAITQKALWEVEAAVRGMTGSPANASLRSVADACLKLAKQSAGELIPGCVDVALASLRNATASAVPTTRGNAAKARVACTLLEELTFVVAELAICASLRSHVSLPVKLCQVRSSKTFFVFFPQNFYFHFRCGLRRQ
jgi:hypothetical protein